MSNENFFVVRKDDTDFECDSMLACSFKDKREAVSYALSKVAQEVITLFDKFDTYEVGIQDDLFTVIDVDKKVKIQYIILPEGEFWGWDKISWNILTAYEPSKFTTVQTDYLDKKFQKRN